MLGPALERIARAYALARREGYLGHPLVRHLQSEAPKRVAGALHDRNGRLVRGSAGYRGWAAVPWIAVFEKRVTASAKRGTYVVYLFHSFEPRFYLALVHGTVDVRTRHGDATRDVLRALAGNIRARLPEFAAGHAGRVELGSIGALPLDYEAAAACAVRYDANALPGEDALVADLNRFADAARSIA